MSGQPVSLARTPSNLVAAPPECGEHTQEVLGEFGFSEGEIAALRSAKGDLASNRSVSSRNFAASEIFGTQEILAPGSRLSG